LDGQIGIAERLVEQVLDLGLKEFHQGHIVGINPYAARNSAVHKEGVTRPGR
jgi:hypothetical protein